MKHNMRRIDRQLFDEQIESILCKCTFGILATVDEENWPYAVPVNYVFNRQSVYFHCAKNAGHKLENIAYNNRVCFTIVGENKTIPEQFATAYESVILFGHVTEVIDDINDVARMFIHRFSPNYIEEGDEYIQKMISRTAFYKIQIEQITGKARK